MQEEIYPTEDRVEKAESGGWSPESRVEVRQYREQQEEQGEEGGSTVGKKVLRVLKQVSVRGSKHRKRVHNTGSKEHGL